MKINNAIMASAFAAFFALLGTSGAATYTITNGSGSSAFGIGDSSGDGFVGIEGVAALGVYSSTDFATFTAQDFIANFTVFGVPTQTNFREAGIFGNNGTFEYSPAGLAANAPYVNQAMLVLVGNAATFALATEFLVLDLGRNFLAADDQVATPQTVAITGSTVVLFGSTIPNMPTFNNDTTINQGFLTAAPIPEPSAALLGALGALALLRRRRN
jgi:MYXO-CTERM domain-containing protein